MTLWADEIAKKEGKVGVGVGSNLPKKGDEEGISPLMNRQLFSSVGLEFKGGTPEGQLGSDGFEVIHPDDIQKCKNIYQSAFEECRHFQIEYRRKDAGGEYRWILETGVPQFSPAGDLLSYIGTCFDITDEKRHLSKEIVKGDSDSEPVSKTLQDSFQFNRYLFDRCPAGLALCRLDGTLVEVNPAVRCHYWLHRPRNAQSQLLANYP